MTPRMRHPVQLFDHVLLDAAAYRARALQQPFQDVTLGPTTFHGIASAFGHHLQRLLQAYLPGCVPGLTFFRQSPLGQPEPHYVHSDADMGDWTAVLYLNDPPDPGDGTLFWEHTGTFQNCGPWADVEADANDPSRWIEWGRVGAQFGRLLVFQADLYHSRALVDNYGAGDGARLVQVAFGTWDPTAPGVLR